MEENRQEHNGISASAKPDLYPLGELERPVTVIIWVQESNLTP